MTTTKRKTTKKQPIPKVPSDTARSTKRSGAEPKRDGEWRRPPYEPQSTHARPVQRSRDWRHVDAALRGCTGLGVFTLANPRGLSKAMPHGVLRFFHAENDGERFVLEMNSGTLVWGADYRAIVAEAARQHAASNISIAGLLGTPKPETPPQKQPERSAEPPEPGIDAAADMGFVGDTTREQIKREEEATAEADDQPLEGDSGAQSAGQTFDMGRAEDADGDELEIPAFMQGKTIEGATHRHDGWQPREDLPRTPRDAVEHE